jgi:hypothetical protein
MYSPKNLSSLCSIAFVGVVCTTGACSSQLAKLTIQPERSLTGETHYRLSWDSEPGVLKSYAWPDSLVVLRWVTKAQYVTDAD